MRKFCVERFWDAVSGGEMDVDRANFCVMWWSTRGGRELVLFGDEGRGNGHGHGADEGSEEGPYMSGALVEGDDETASKL